MIEVVRPTLLLDEAKCRANIRRMAEKARRNGILLRPHFKTHQSHEVGRWFREEGINSCTVSSIKMAAYFADDGWKDITVAFPLNALEAEVIQELSSDIALHLAAVNREAVELLAKDVREKVGIFIEVDTGYRRSGVAATDFATIDGIIEATERSGFIFRGFLSHSGQSYACRSGKEIMDVHEASLGVYKGLANQYKKKYPDLRLSLGDTPTCSVAEKFEGLTEIRPGNFVFYDFMQTEIGSCSFGDIAAVMACPVVAVYPERSEAIVHGGGVHLSKDSWKRKDGVTTFGEAVKLTTNGWEQKTGPLYLRSLSQEHGILAGTREEIDQLKVGDLIGIVPVHSCMTADVMGVFYVEREENRNDEQVRVEGPSMIFAAANINFEGDLGFESDCR